MKKADWVKARTQELYDMLPQTTLEERNGYTDIRDEILDLNYSFFGYIAKNQYVTDPLATYEDKLQVALISFCQMWAKYKFAPSYNAGMEFQDFKTYTPGDYVFHDGKLYECRAESDISSLWENKDWMLVKTYRTDLSFTVFFKPRLSECVRRELNIIKYSLRRQICMKAAAQLGKPWGQLTKEDIDKVKLPPQEMHTLEAIFSTQYDTTYDDEYLAKARIAQQNSVSTYWIDSIYNEQYDSLEDLIVHEMIEHESKLEDSYLLKMSEMYDIPYADLEKARPLGEAKLKRQLEESMYIKEAFESESGYGDNSDIED